MIDSDFLILGIFLVTEVLLLLFGVHYIYLIIFYLQNRNNNLVSLNVQPIRDFPIVTIQIPIYNEKFVIENVIRNILNMNYPRSKLQIQILDDSTDETVFIVEKLVKDKKNKGYIIDQIRRQNREGFKAGALNNGLKYAKGELIAIFDADFLPPKSFLRDTVPYLTINKKLGCLQTRWGHLNSKKSMLTQTIALGIDGHFIVEQNVRSKMDVINFNGTCGIWRKECILDVGGWDGRILAEDLDLSYRAHLKGWKIKYIQNVICPGEIPSTIMAFKQQQYRWAKGSIQCARKNLNSVWRSPEFNRTQKIEATFHHLGYMVQFLMVLLIITTIPLLDNDYFIFLGPGLIFAYIAIAAPSMYFVAAQELNYSVKESFKLIFLLTLLGIGISFNNGRAAFFGFFQSQGEFNRTPKQGKNDIGYGILLKWDIVFEIGLLFYCLYGIYLSFIYENYLVFPYIAFYALGLSWVILLTIKQSLSQFYPASKSKNLI